VDPPGEERRPAVISQLLRRVLMVATVVVLSALLYVTVTGLFGGPTQTAPLTVDVFADGTNWTVRFTGVPAGRLPGDMFLLIRNASTGIVLPRVSFDALSASNWTAHHALYADANPSAMDVRSGDRLEIDARSYPLGSTIEISDRTSLLLIKALA